MSSCESSSSDRDSAANTTEIEQLRAEAQAVLAEVLTELRRVAPKVVEAAGGAVGATLGGGASFTALYFGGSVAGFSAAGVTSGLATAGALVGGGMVAGVGVLAVPIALGGFVGYGLVRRRRNVRLAAALCQAVNTLRAVEERLRGQADHLRDELAEIRAYIRDFEDRLR